MPDAPYVDHDVPAGTSGPPGPIAPAGTSEARPSPAEEARSLVASTATAVLGSLSEDGGPWASMVTFGALGDGSPVLVVSQLAEHGRNLARDHRASLCVTATEGVDDPLAAARVTVAGRVEEATGDEAEAARVAYAAAVPAASMFVGFGDFTTWVLRVERVRWVGGYGRMSSADAADYAAAEPDPVRPASAGAVAHLNADHADALLDMARALGGHPDATAAACTGADRYGLDLTATGPRGVAAVRVAYDAPLADASGLRAATVALAKLARAAD